VNTKFGQRLYVTGVSTDVTEAQLREFLLKYTQEVPTAIDRVDLNTALPAYVVSFSGLADGEIQKFAARINEMYWHGHLLNVHVM
jgi:hypothetical protein